MLDQVDDISQVSADGRDSFECYQRILEREAEPVIPPRNDAIERAESDEKPEIAARNQVVRKVKGSKIWKEESAYHRRSLAETAMFRIKTLFGNQLKARLFESQAFVRCVVLNSMTALGMPDSYPV